MSFISKRGLQRVSALATAAGAGVMLIAGTAHADGVWDTTRSTGVFHVEIDSTTYGAYVSTSISDTNCDSNGVGIRVKFYDDASNELYSVEHWQGAGCNTGIRSQGTPIYATDLNGKRSGWAKFQTMKGSSFFSTVSDWGSTYWAVK